MILVSLAFFAGGVLKGAAGAGAPLLAVPLMAMLFNVQFAVAVQVLPNIVPNVWQFFQCRESIASRPFSTMFAVMGGIGAGLGTIPLAGWRPDVLMLTVGIVLVAYIIFRLLNPEWQMSRKTGLRLAAPVGLAAGALQGATGLSAPISLTFLNALRMERRDFMATISAFFIALGLVQFPVQVSLGIMTSERLLYGVLALIPLMAGMPVGAWIGARFPRHVFERVTLGILAVLAAKLLWEAM